MRDFEFKDPELAAAITDAHEALSGRIEELDDLSSDIKALEAYLTAHGVVYAIAVMIPGETGYLTWVKGEPDRFRLCYEDNVTRKPLIECKAAVRLKAKAAMPLLVREILDQLPRRKP